MIDIENDLRRDFPALYSRPIDLGADVPPGWVTLVHELSAELEEMVSEMEPGWRPHVMQIKQKLGSLRMGMSFATVPMMHAIRAVEQRSRETCEQCGLAGSLRSGEFGWRSTLCDGCAAS